MSIIRSMSVFLILASTAACSTTQYPSAQAVLSPHEAIYRLGSGDTVQVTVYDEPELSGKFTVDSQGMLSLPLLGKVGVAGKTEEETAAIIKHALVRNNLLKQPRVSIETVVMRPFFITGEVERGGAFPFRPDLTVYQSVVIAGGYTYRADRDDITIIRRQKGKGAETLLSAKENTPVLPGDLIEIGERFF